MQKPKKVISIFTKTHINHDQTHNTGNNLLGPIFFSPGDKVTLSNDRVLFVPLRGIAPENSWLRGGRVFEGLHGSKIILGDLNCTMDKIDRDGEYKAQILYRCCSNYAL